MNTDFGEENMKHLIIRVVLIQFQCVYTLMLARVCSWGVSNLTTLQQY